MLIFMNEIATDSTVIQNMCCAESISDRYKAKIIEYFKIKKVITQAIKPPIFFYK